MASKKDRIVDRLSKFRRDRESVKELQEKVKTVQPELLAMMADADPSNHGIVYDEMDDAKGTAYVQRNQPTERWDQEAVIDYLKKNKMWTACSSRVFDQRKWDAEVANGNIPARDAVQLRIIDSAPTPFIRFGKKSKESQ